MILQLGPIHQHEGTLLFNPKPKGEIMFVNKSLWLLPVLTSLLLANQPGEDQPSSKPLVPLSRALQFQLGDNFKLSSFEGSTISYKVFRTPNQELRLALSISGEVRQSDRNSNSERNYGTSDSILNATSSWNEENRYVNFRLGAYQLNHFSSSTGISGYWGGGPFVLYNRAHLVRETNAGDPDSPWNKHDDAIVSAMGIGVQAIFGTEWRFTDAVGLTAEYQPYVSYTYENRENTSAALLADLSTENQNQVTKSPIVALSSKIRIGLSFYF